MVGKPHDIYIDEDGTRCVSMNAVARITGHPPASVLTWTNRKQTGSGFPIETRYIQGHKVWTEASLQAFQEFTREHPIRRGCKKLYKSPFALSPA